MVSRGWAGGLAATNPLARATFRSESGPGEGVLQQDAGGDRTQVPNGVFWDSQALDGVAHLCRNAQGGVVTTGGDVLEGRAQGTRRVLGRYAQRREDGQGRHQDDSLACGALFSSGSEEHDRCQEGLGCGDADRGEHSGHQSVGLPVVEVGRGVPVHKGKVERRDESREHRGCPQECSFWSDVFCGLQAPQLARQEQR